jgi:hypothetical protein
MEPCPVILSKTARDYEAVWANQSLSTGGPIVGPLA